MHSIEQTLPRPTTQFRRREWLELQRALDPLAPPKPLSAVIRESDDAEDRQRRADELVRRFDRLA